MSLAFGIHDGIPPDTYHGDPTETPSLSASIANTLINKSPAHARAAHPKLNPDFEHTEEAKFDIGTTAHALLLQHQDLITELDYPDWRTNDAKIARDAARANGLIPLLADQAQRVRAMVAAAREGIASHTAQPPLFTNGKPEQTLVWEDDHGVICRARLDWLHDDYAAVDDLKTCGRTAKPKVWGKTTMWNIGAALQARFYQRGVYRLTGIEPDFRFVVIETEPPYALSVVSLAPSAAAVADAQIEHALQTWAACLKTGEWPAYEPRVYHVDVPTWTEMEWLETMAEGAAA